MKAYLAINFADQIEPNSFDDDIKIYWLQTLEGKIAADVMLMAPAELEQFNDAYFKENTLLAKPPHDDIYVLWLVAQIQLACGEYDKYQNSLILYNEAYGNFVRWFAENFSPGDDRPSAPRYYITAYGLAVNEGYTGSLTEWLDSLVGKSAYQTAVENGFQGTEVEWDNKTKRALSDCEFAASAAERSKKDAEIAASSAEGASTNAWTAAREAGTARDAAANIAASLRPENISVGTNNLKDGSVTGPKIAPASVSNDKLAGGITKDKLGPGSVDESKFVAGAVSTRAVANEAITGEKLAGNSVDSKQLKANCISKNKLNQELQKEIDGKAPDYTVSTSGLTPGSSALTTNTLWIQYE